MIAWWRSNWGRVVGQAVAIMLAGAVVAVAFGILVGAGRLGIWLAGF